MAAESEADRLEGTLLALLRHEQRLARWESLPRATRQEAVEQIARMMLQVVAGEGGDEAGDAGAAAAS